MQVFDNSFNSETHDCQSTISTTKKKLRRFWAVNNCDKVDFLYGDAQKAETDIFVYRSFPMRAEEELNEASLINSYNSKDC